ncbi:hypothetical protein BVY01_00570 [bacterium I07]|nr:hypothetical protein BVY01_00570 [bacterium I07]
MIVDRSSPIPQYFQLQTWLMEQIDQGVFNTGDKVPTEEELVEMTGLARATIRQALRNLVQMGYLNRKKRLGTFVSDRTGIQTKKTMIGVLVPDIRHGYAPELARGAEDEAANNMHSIILCNTDDLFVKANVHAQRLIDLDVSGVIFVPTAAADEKNESILNRLKLRGIPCVLADRQITMHDADNVTTDNLEGGFRLTEYLIKNGHRRIAVTLSTLFSTERLRLNGYRKALEAHGIPYDPDLCYCNNRPFVETRFMRYANQILTAKKDVTAIFAGHDRIAYAVYQEAGKLGIRIPEDISLVGYDDLPSSGSHSVQLTTMHQPIYEMGRESMKLILKRIRKEEVENTQVTLKSYLVERNSVKAV